MNESGGPSLADFMPNTLEPGEPVVARLGLPLAPGVKVSDKTEIIKALRTVHDPEIPVNIYDLGLIYDLEVKTDGTVIINMTLTALVPPAVEPAQPPIMAHNSNNRGKNVGQIEKSVVR